VATFLATRYTKHVFIIDKHLLKGDLEVKQTMLGILVVLCMQFGFIVYSAVERPLDPLVAVNEIPMLSVANADVPETWDGLDLLDTNPDREVGGDVAFASAKRTIRRPSGTRRSLNNIVTGPVNFEPVVIAYQKLPAVEFRTEYPQNLPVSSKPANYQLPAKTVPLPERKRSFLSRSAAVLKKPYDWLKAVGSRLD